MNITNGTNFLNRISDSQLMLLIAVLIAWNDAVALIDHNIFNWIVFPL